MAKVTIPLTLDTARDAELLSWLDAQPAGKRSDAIREALRGHLVDGRESGATIADVLLEIRLLRRDVAAAASGVAPGNRHVDDRPEEPPDVAAALDRLGV